LIAFDHRESIKEPIFGIVFGLEIGSTSEPENVTCERDQKEKKV
jgi:hypothetical protein